jgi:hypothetical protein
LVSDKDDEVVGATLATLKELTGKSYSSADEWKTYLSNRSAARVTK